MSLLSTAFIEHHCMPKPCVNPGPRECSGCELAMTLPSRPLQWLLLEEGSGAGSSLWPAGLCGPAPSPLLYFPPLSLPCSFSPRPFLAQDVCTRSSSTWNAFSWPPFTWLVSLLWVSDDHPTMTSPPHLQTWLPPPASSPRPQCSPAPLDSFLGAQRCRLSLH